MAETRANVYAIYGVAQEYEDEPFDHSMLPASIVPTVTIEDVTRIFTPDAFKLFEEGLSPRDLKSLKAVKYAIVHRYETTDFHDEASQKLETGQIVHDIAACLRLIRPMRQFALRIHGVFKNDGTLDVAGFDVPLHLMEIPAIQQGFTLRNRDIVELQSVAAKCLLALAGEYWKFRMPIALHDTAHLIENPGHWKARMSLMCSAIEAVYTSQTRDGAHSGSRVAKARIKWFLGENTSIYAPGDIPSFSYRGKEPTIADVLDDLYEVRNCIAHGDKVPDKFFTSRYDQPQANHMSTLEEAASFIVRASLLKVLKHDLLEHFKGSPESQAYFASFNLVRSKL